MRTREESLEYLKKNFNPKEFTAPIGTHYIPWLNELDAELREQSQKVYRILEGLLSVDRIFTVGMGRSELMIRNTGMRLMHEGYDVYSLGESYTPAIGNDPKHKDSLLFYSGSGTTRFVITAERKSKENNVPIYGVCSNIDSEAVKIAGEENVIITKGKRIYTKREDVPPEGKEPTSFLQTESEDKAYHIGEFLVNEIAKAKGLTEADFKKRHANAE